MKKAEMKMLVKEWNISIGKMDGKADRLFEDMKDLNERYGDGNRWCSIQMNYDGVIKNEFNTSIMYRAHAILEKYYMYKGQEEALRAFLRTTNNFDL